MNMEIENKKEKLINNQEQDDVLINSAPKSSPNRYAFNVNSKIQHVITDPKILTNKICTSRYNIFNVFPKILWEQFSKIGNIYFLILSILQVKYLLY